MKRYIFILLSSLLPLVGTHLLLFWFQLGIPTESSRWVEEAYALKEQRAHAIVDRKVLIISGSNCLFSISAEDMEARLDMPVVNCGIHAGLKIEYILDRSSKLVSAGDIVVLPLEYSAYSYVGETSIVLSDFLASRDPGYLVADTGRVLNTAFSFSVVDLCRRNLKRFYPDQPVVGYYDASYLNAHGDKTNISESLMTEVDRETLKSCRPINLSFSEGGIAAKSIGDFIKRCNEVGAHVLVTFPTTIGFDDYASHEFLDEVGRIRTFVEESGGRVIGNPDDFFFPIEYFFNTAYHANEKGQEESTERLIELLLKFLDETGIKP